jgi:hypothetical protein
MAGSLSLLKFFKRAFLLAGELLPDVDSLAAVAAGLADIVGQERAAVDTVAVDIAERVAAVGIAGADTVERAVG